MLLLILDGKVWVGVCVLSGLSPHCMLQLYASADFRWESLGWSLGWSGIPTKSVTIFIKPHY